MGHIGVCCKSNCCRRAPDCRIAKQASAVWLLLHEVSLGTVPTCGSFAGVQRHHLAQQVKGIITRTRKLLAQGWRVGHVLERHIPWQGLNTWARHMQ
jgi:hypothetical protein